MFPKMSRRKADAISNGIFFILLGVLFYTNAWWPGILIAIGVTFALRQFLTGRTIDFFITVGILTFIVAVSFAGFAFSILMPLLFVLGGLYIIIREFFFPHGFNVESQDQDQDPTQPPKSA